jgi:hypothetical protein
MELQAKQIHKQNIEVVRRGLGCGAFEILNYFQLTRRMILQAELLKVSWEINIGIVNTAAFGNKFH